jgi:hypothetical protein
MREITLQDFLNRHKTDTNVRPETQDLLERIHLEPWTSIGLGFNRTA